jgi:hypothetical protein
LGFSQHRVDCILASLQFTADKIPLSVGVAGSVTQRQQDAIGIYE